MNKKRSMFLNFWFLLLIMLFSGFAPVQAALNEVGTWGRGPCNAVFAFNNRLYMGTGRVMDILDISNPQSPVKLGSVTLEGYIYSIDVSGSYAYAAVHTDGLQVVDISNPASPTVVGAYDTPGYAEDVHVEGSYAYVAAFHKGLRIINISTPSAPTETAYLENLGNVWGVFVSGSYVYAACEYDGLRVIDISTPTTPVEVGHLGAPLSYSLDVFVSGNYAYVADRGNGFRVVDISNPQSPNEVAYRFDTTFDVHISGNYAYTADAFFGIRVYDISNPTNPLLSGTLATPGEANDIHVLGSYAYVSNLEEGMRVVNVSNPASPTEVASVETPDEAVGIDVSGNYAYIANHEDGLRIINIASPTSPAAVGDLDTPGIANNVRVSGSYAYLTELGGDLRIINISNPASPSEVGSWSSGEPLNGLDVKGNYVYLANMANGLVVINVSNPASPTQVGSQDTPGNARDVMVYGTHAYVADDGNGLVVIDISDHASMSIVSTLSLPDTKRIFASGIYSYLVQDGWGLRVADIQDPLNPVALGLYSSMIFNLDARGAYVYTTDYGVGFDIYDVSNPSAPVRIADNTTLNGARDVRVANGYAYVADGYCGLSIIDLAGYIPYINVTAPGDSETWPSGSTQQITWGSSGIGADVRLEYSIDAGLTWIEITAATENDGIYDWTVPNDPATDCKVRVTDLTDTVSDVSTGTFTIEPDAALSIIAPNGFENFFTGEETQITWNTSDSVDNVVLYYSSDGGITWNYIYGPTPDTGSYSWTTPNIPSDCYLVKIEDENLLVEDQSDDFFTVSASTLEITAPNGPEQFFIGEQIDITWNSAGTVDEVMLFYSTNDGITWDYINGPVPNTNTYSWTLPNIPSEYYRVRIEDAQFPDLTRDESDDPFTVLAATLEITAPNGPEQFFIGTQIDITWNTTGPVDEVMLFYSTNDGITWDYINGPVPNTNTYSWTLPNVPSDYYRVRIEDAQFPDLTRDESDDPFTVLAPTLEITAPNGPEQFFIGTQTNITWNTTGPVNEVMLFYSTNDGITWDYIDGPVPNNNTFSWTLPNVPSDYYRVRIEDAQFPDLTRDESDAPFIVSAPTLEITAPNGTEQFYMGTGIDITWNTIGPVNEVMLLYSTNDGISWDYIAGPVPNTNTYSWTLPNVPSDLYRVRIENADFPEFTSDVSDAPFIVSAPTLEITSPNGSEQYYMGTDTTVTWNTGGPVINVMLFFSTDGGSTWQPISGSPVPNTGSYLFTMPNIPSGQCLVKIENFDFPELTTDVSDNYFSILAPTLTITYPNTGSEEFFVGANEVITWNTAGPAANVLLYYSIDGGAAWDFIAGPIANTGSYSWTVPDTPSNQCLVKIEEEVFPNYTSDVNDAMFTISPVQIPASEREALIELYNSTNGDSWTDNTNWRDPVDPGQFNAPGTEHTWFGITVNSTSGKVEAINLPNNNLVGTIPDPSYFTDLLQLNLSGNQLEGVIPYQVGNLAALTGLHLENNQLSGSIPVETGNLTALTALFLQGNRLTGDIPTTLTNLTNLPTDGLNISWNGLHTSDGALQTFLDSKQVGGDWESTQTIAPAGLTVDSVTDNSAVLSWTPILYQADTGVYNIYYSITSGSGYTLAGTTADKYESTYTVTGLEPNTTYYFVVETVTGPHVNNQNTVTSEYSTEASGTTDMTASITVTAPNGSETVYMGNDIDITWTSTGTVNDVIITYSYDSGGDWHPVSGGPIPNTGTFTWTTPNTPSSQCLVRVEDGAGMAVDQSNNYFTIAPPTITVTNPNTNFAVYMGYSYDITWTTEGNVDNVIITYYDGYDWHPVSGGSIPNTGTFTWTVPNTPSDQCLVRIEEENSYAVDQSDTYFTIAPPTITVTNPNTNFAVYMGYSYDITWTTEGKVDNVIITYTDGYDWYPVSGGPIPNTGIFTWTVPNTPSDQCLVRIEEENSFAIDQSDTYFTIAPPTITVTNPNTNFAVYMGSPYNITWTTEGKVDNVIITYTDGYGGWYPVSGGAIPNTGTYNWLVPNTPSNQCLVRIEEENYYAVDQSDTYFTIAPPTITVTNPNTSFAVYMGYPYDITWTTEGNVNNVIITYTDGIDWYPVSGGPIPNTGIFNWLVPNTPSNQCLVRIEEENLFAMDQSDFYFTIAPPTITVTFPDGTEDLTVGSSQDITWTSEGKVDNVVIQYTYDGGMTWYPVSGGPIPNTGTFTWTVPDTPSGECRVMVEEENLFAYDQSNGLFTISPMTIPTVERDALIALYNSTNGDNWTTNTNWRDPGDPAQFNAPGTEPTWFGVTVSGTAHVEGIDLQSNSLSGTIPDLSSLTYLRQLNLSGNQLTGSIPYEIGNLAALNGLHLENNQLSGSIPVETGNLTFLTALFLQGNQLAGSIPTTLTNLTALPTDGLNISWNGLYTSDGTLKTFLDSKQVGGDWESTQTTAPTGLAVDSVTATTASLSWTPILYQADSGTYRVYYSTISGSGYTLAGATADKYASSYTVTGLSPTTTYYFVVEAVTDPHVNNQNTVTSEYSTEVSGTTLASESLTVISPDGSESWEANTTETITWSSTGTITDVKIEYSTDNGSTWNTVVASTPNSGTYNWTVPNTPSAQCLVRLTDPVSLVSDVSNGVFSILEMRTIRVDSPNGGEDLRVGSNHYILWTTTGAIGTVHIEYSSDGGSTWNTIHSSHPNGGVYNWMLPDIESYDCLVRISDTAGPATDTSDAVFSITPPGIPLYERDALIALFNATDGYNWRTNLNWLDPENPSQFNDRGTEGTWFGITLNAEGTHVEKIEMVFNYMTGTIPTQLNQLSELKVLDLNYNNLTGPITDLTGLTQLTYLDLSTNNFPGPIPAWISSMTNLTYLSLGACELTGSIIDLSGLTQLQTLNLSWNDLTGTVPSWINQLTALEYLNLKENQLSGTVPDLDNLTALKGLYLSNNQFTGSIPNFAGAANLENLGLHFNQFSGSIPTWFSNLSSVIEIRLYNNQLTGTIPDLSALTNLLGLYLYNNQLSGSIPPGLGSIPNLQSLSLMNNQFTGAIPPELANLSTLGSLDLHGNQLSGNIPAELGSLVNLWYLQLQNNQLSGTIPTELGNLTALKLLYLEGNQLSGAIPAEIGNLTALNGLKLYGNQLTGEIPTTLTNLTALSSTAFDITYNGLYTDDATLRSFLDANHNGPWEDTQTIAPVGVSTGEETHDSVKISWTPIQYQSDSGGYKVYYSTTSGSGYQLAGTTADKTVDNYIVTGLTPNTTYYFVVETFTDPNSNNDNTVTSQYSVEVSTATLENPTLTVTAPNGGQSWEVATTQAITWNSTGNITDVKIEYSTDSGNTWNTVIASTPNNGTYDWTIPNTPSTTCLVKISDIGALAEDTSDGVFTIAEQRTITVTAPDGSENWEGGTVQNITWNSTGSIANVMIEYSIDNGGSWNTVIASTANSGTYGWTVPNTPSTNCLVRISDTAGPASDTSNGVFTIAEQRTITVTAPDGSEIWEGGFAQDITWNSTGSIANVMIEYSIDNGSSWNTVIASTANSGSYSWLVPNTPSGNCLVKITDTAGPASDTSNGVFTIAEQRTVTVTAPDGSESWEGGTVQNITWNSTGSIANVMIEYSTDNGGSWNTVIASTANSGTYGWTVPNTPSPNCLVRISDTAGPASDISNAVFNILEMRTVMVITPDGSEDWQVGSSHDITWSTTGDIANVSIEYSTDGGSLWNSITASTSNNGTYNWSIPDTPSTDCLVKVSDIAGPASDTSNAVFTISIPTITQLERDALIALYNSTNGDSWTDNTNWRKPGEPSQFNDPGTEYTWYGVFCNAEKTHVTSIQLVNNNLVGTIPDLASLTWLTSLYLNNNQLTGSIPTGINNLVNLQGLYLYSNQLSGTIPDLSSLVNLTALFLGYNQLSGSVPAWLNLLTNLEQLHIGSNQLTGTIPDLSSLTQLIGLGLGHNQFTGNIPDLSSLVNLEALYLGTNQLSGSIPAWINNLTNLHSLELQYNDFSGPIPYMGNLTQLTKLLLHNNELTGSIPSEITSMTNLTVLNLGHNQLDGSIPPALGNLTGLRSIRLDSNQLDGTIPSELGNIPNLNYLYLDSNKLTGSIPGSLANLTNLYSSQLDISRNGLYTTDTALRDFLNTKQVGGDWEATQTIAPTGLAAGEETHESINVSWTPILYQADSGGYNIYYSTTSGSGYTLAGTTADKTIDNYTVTGLDPFTTYYFVVETVTNPNGSNQNTVTSEYSAEVSASTQENPTLTVTAPDGGQSWEGTTTQSITWNSTGNITDVKIEYSTDNGNTWNTIIASTPNSGSYDWTVPNTPSTDCLVKITDIGGLASDTSNGVFTITELRTITVTAPDGGQNWEGGTSQNITWNSTGAISNVKIEYSTDNGSNWNTIIASTANSGSYSWSVPNTPSSNCLVKITDTAGPASDTSNGVFTIAAERTITVTAPDGSESWEGGTDHNITWNSTGAISNVKIEYSIDNGSSWSTEAASTANDGSYNWTVPNSPSTQCLVKISDTAGTASDTSNAVFTIAAQRTITVTAPDGSENWEGTTSHNITWNSTGTISNVKIEYSIDNGGSWSTEAASTANDGSYNWTVPNSPSTQCLVKISDTAGTASDTSNAVFTIAALRTLTVTAPDGSESWEGGTDHNITWNSTGTISNVKIEYSIDNGGSWSTEAASTANDGSYNWTVPNTPSTQCLVKISDTAGTASDTSSAVFTIVTQRTITVTAPDGSENWEGTTSHNITWNSTGTISNVKIEYSTDNGGTWNTEAASTANDGSYNWTVPNTPSTQCLVKISDTAGPASDTSNAVFTIAALRTLTVTAPDGSESWEGGTNHNITWDSTGAISNVKIEYSIDNGGSWSTETASTANDGSYNWTVPNTPSTNCLVRISDTAGTASDTSSAVFTIVTQRTITVTAPDGSENWEGTTSHNITWNSTGAISNVKIEYSTDNGGSWSTEAASTANDGSYNWTVPNIPSTQCLVKISDTAGPASDTSNAVFTIAALRTLTVMAPDGGENWEGGTNHNITWNSTGVISNVKIEYSINNGGSWDTATASTANDGSFNWTVPNTPSTQCIVRISDTAGPAADSSNALFTILEQRTITVTNPDGGEIWEGNYSQTITWNSTGNIANVTIEYSINGGSTWDTAVASTANDGSYNWTVPNTPSTNCLVKISDTAGPASDTSNGVFTIEEQRTLTVTAPNGGESWRRRSTQTITWNSTGNVGNVEIHYSMNGGSTWTLITGSTANDGSYQWTLPNVASDQTNCLVKIAALDGSCEDTSNAPFTISKH